MDFTT